MEHIDPDKEGKFITYELHKMVTVDNRLKNGGFGQSP